MLLMLLVACTTEAPSDPVPEPVFVAEVPPRPTHELLLELELLHLATAAVEGLIAREAVQELEQVALQGEDLGARGWAIHGLVSLQQGQQTLATVQHDEENPELVRVWAAAGRIAMADRNTLEDLRPLAQRWPELERPLTLREAQL